MALGIDTFRYRYGDTCPVTVSFDNTGGGSFPISIGDLVWIDSGDTTTGDGSFAAKAADSKPWNTSLAQTQQDFCAAFLGVAAQRYDGTNANAYGLKDGKLRVDTAGVFEFACAANSSFNVGDLVGPAKAAGNALLSQTVVSVTTNKNQAIGRVAQAVQNASSVLVEIYSTKLNVGTN